MIRKVLWILLGAALFAAASLSPALADLDEEDLPPGFYQIAAAPGVQFYQKDYSPGNPDYVQVVDLSQGASVELLHAPLREPRPNKGVYGGADPRFGFNTIQGFWKQLSQSHPSAFCVTNGQFFYMKENPTRLAFPLKKDGVVVTDGWAIEQYPGEKLMFEIWDDRVDIVELSKWSLYGSKAPDILAGLTAKANKRAKDYTGRTFVGVDDRDQNGSFETVLVFNTKTARQKDADQVLTSFGADKVMMLDGGGSTQLVCQGETLIESGRLIPQALGLVAGKQAIPTSTSMPDSLGAALAAPRLAATPIPIAPPATQSAKLEHNIPQESGVMVFSDVLWVPLMILPIAFVALFIAARVRS
jgi:hypothetical protein